MAKRRTAEAAAEATRPTALKFGWILIRNREEEEEEEEINDGEEVPILVEKTQNGHRDERAYEGKDVCLPLRPRGKEEEEEEKNQ